MYSDCDVDGQTKYVCLFMVPVFGDAAVWGYMALNDDEDTVYGVSFSHEEKLRVWVQKSPLLSSRMSSWANM